MNDNVRTHTISRAWIGAARQLGFADKRECPHLCKLAADYLKKTEGVEENIYAFFADDLEVDSLFVKLVEEFERCILSYFAFHWRHAHTMISQVMNIDTYHCFYQNIVSLYC